MTKILHSFALIAALGIGLAAFASCQENKHTATTQKPTASLPRLLHFWIGEWDCYSANSGQINGYNELTSRLNGKIIHEHWTPVGGGPGGESWNYYDPNSRTWRQHWMDPAGRPFVFVGKSHRNGILYEGPHFDGKPNPNRRRMFIRPIGNGRVQQTGTQSSDGGKTWQPEYDLVYVPRGEPFHATSKAAPANPARQFDFLVGDWQMDVEQYDSQGKLIRKLTDWSRVRTKIGGASLLDEWGGSGFTVRTWDPRKRVWRLFWTDQGYSAGNMQMWEGTFKDGVGTFIGGYQATGSNQTVSSKIEFSEITRDSVLWKMWKTPDNGKTWVLDYIRRYKRVESVYNVKKSSPTQAPKLAQVKQQAIQLMTSGQYEKAATLYRQITNSEPQNGLAWFRLGYCLHAMGELDEAIKANTKAASFGGQVAQLANYNLACAYALQEKTDRAIAALEKAISLGFKNTNQLANDSDLNHIREDKRFSELVRRLSGGK